MKYYKLFKSNYQKSKLVVKIQSAWTEQGFGVEIIIFVAGVGIFTLYAFLVCQRFCTNLAHQSKDNL